jgi:hypothetical protein
MKTSFCLVLALCIAVVGRAQSPATGYSPDQLDQMVGPIALYPDPLIALILPASTTPADITAAAQYLAGGGDPAGVDSQPWAPSVKGLAHYPEVVKWMNDNLPWTQALGAAFAMQPSDVMKSVQQLRAKANAAGTLVSTPQQSVDVEDDDIRIVPAQDDTMYVPQYDPDDVYDVPEGYSGPFVTFGVGYPVGPWLGFECDWDDFGIWAGPWQRGWAYRREWRNPGFGGGRWHPDPRSAHVLVRNFYHPGAGLPGPRLIAGAHAGPRAGAFAANRGAVTITHSAPDYRGYGGMPPRPSSPAPAGALFGGYDRGVQTRDFSNRGRESRQAPVRSAPPQRSAPERAAPERSPSGGGRDRQH